MDLNSCVKVTFRAKVKNEIPSELANKIRSEAQSIDGFISMNTTTNDNDVEITTSYWKSMMSVKAWSQNEHHVEVKKNVDKYYEWVKFEMDENHPYPPSATS